MPVSIGLGTEDDLFWERIRQANDEAEPKLEDQNASSIVGDDAAYLQDAASAVEDGQERNVEDQELPADVHGQAANVGTGPSLSKRTHEPKANAQSDVLQNSLGKILSYIPSRNTPNGFELLTSEQSHKMRNEMNNAWQEFDSMKQQLQERSLEVAFLRGDREAMKEQSNLEIRQLKEKLLEAEQTQDGVEEHDFSMASMLEDYKISTAADKRDELKQKLDDATARIAQQDTRLEELEAQARDAKAQNFRLREANSRAASIMSTYGRSSSTAGRRLSARASSISSLDSEITDDLRHHRGRASKTSITTPDTSLSPETQAAADEGERNCERLLTDLLAKTLVMRCKLALSASHIPRAEKLATKAIKLVQMTEDDDLRREAYLVQGVTIQEMRRFMKDRRQRSHGSRQSMHLRDEDEGPESHESGEISMILQHQTPEERLNRSFRSSSTHSSPSSASLSTSRSRKRPIPLGLGISNIGTPLGPIEEQATTRTAVPSQLTPAKPMTPQSRRFRSKGKSPTAEEKARVHTFGFPRPEQDLRTPSPEATTPPFASIDSTMEDAMHAVVAPREPSEDVTDTSLGVVSRPESEQHDTTADGLALLALSPPGSEGVEQLDFAPRTATPLLEIYEEGSAALSPHLSTLLARPNS